MTEVAATTLAECEATIRRGLTESAAALRRIRDDRLYRQAEFRSFDTYCRDRLGIGRNRADQIIAAGEVIAELPTNVGSSLNEAQARALGPISHDPEYMAEILAEVKAENGKITGAAITTKIDERRRRAQELTARIDEKLVELHQAAATVWANALDAHARGDIEVWEACHDGLALIGECFDAVYSGDPERLLDLAGGGGR